MNPNIQVHLKLQKKHLLYGKRHSQFPIVPSSLEPITLQPNHFANGRKFETVGKTNKTILMHRVFTRNKTEKDLRFGYMEDQGGDTVKVTAVIVTAVYDLGEVLE